MTHEPSEDDSNPSYVVLDKWEATDDSNYFTSDVLGSSGDDVDGIPLYRSKFKTVLQEFGEDKSDEKIIKKNGCFNCQGDHSLMECTEPRDRVAIERNKSKFRKSSGVKMSLRYHLHKDQIYSHIKPGQISTKLREALNLEEDQLPRHIYIMRKLGYPPAWLEEAKIVTSGMSLFDSEMEENDDKFGKESFDITKIIDFPGFNVEASSDTKHEARLYGCPPMSSHQSKETMIEALQTHNTVMAENVQAPSEKTNISMDDQKVEKKLRKSSTELVGRVSAGSPSLADLETQKQLLMKELEVGCSSFNNEGYSTPIQSPNVGKVKKIDLGTPILKSASPYSKTPSADNFSRGVCDLEFFVNLPGTEGHYNRVNNVINKLRKSLSNKNAESPVDTNQKAVE